MFCLMSAFKKKRYSLIWAPWKDDYTVKRFRSQWNSFTNFYCKEHKTIHSYDSTILLQPNLSTGIHTSNQPFEASTFTGQCKHEHAQMLCMGFEPTIQIDSIGFIWIRTGSSEHHNKPSGFIKGREFVDYLNNNYPLKKDHGPCS
jgi:hypothetical protein